jgi:hypothetical protein
LNILDQRFSFRHDHPSSVLGMGDAPRKRVMSRR